MRQQQMNKTSNAMETQGNKKKLKQTTDTVDRRCPEKSGKTLDENSTKQKFMVTNRRGLYPEVELNGLKRKVYIYMYICLGMGRKPCMMQFHVLADINFQTDCYFRIAPDMIILYKCRKTILFLKNLFLLYYKNNCLLYLL